jgi:hypothetical protein
MTLDHVGYVGRALDPLLRAFVALGFAPTAPAVLAPHTQTSAHVVFAEGYLEFSAVAAPKDAPHLAAYLRDGDSLAILAFGVDDIASAHAGCLSRGVPVTRPARAAREIAYGERDGTARFEWFMVEPRVAREGLVCFVQHQTPELVHQPAVQRHANGATALREVAITCADPGEAVERYVAMLGRRPQRRGADYAFAFGESRVRLVTPASLASSLGVRALPAAGRFASVTVASADLDGARAVLKRNRIRANDVDGALLVSAAKAGGASLRLIAA